MTDRLDRRDQLFVRYRHRPGGTWLHTRVLRPEDQFFSLRQEETGETRHWLIRDLYAAAKIADCITAVLDQEGTEHVMRWNGIEQAHLDRLSPAQLEEPGILIRFPDGKSTVIDGNHRWVRRYQLGERTMRFFCFAEEQARLAMLILPEAYERIVLA